MADLEAADTRLSFDDILEAVQDSRRGRWFLQEYESRLQKRDTQSIMQAINRLESRMETMGSSGQSTPDDMTRVRLAINNARNDLLKLGLGKDAMSKEGRLFAEIAEMARKSMPMAVDSNAGIVRTLQLVEEIDTAIAGTVDRGAQFFAADAALFDRPPVPAKPVMVAEPNPAPANDVAKPAAATVAPAEKKEDAAPVGARLVIRKATDATEQQIETVPAQPVSEMKSPPEIIADVLAPEPVQVEHKEDLPSMDNPRIVIIRRKAEDMPEVEVGPRNETAA